MSLHDLLVEQGPLRVCACVAMGRACEEEKKRRGGRFWVRLACLSHCSCVRPHHHTGVHFPASTEGLHGSPAHEVRRVLSTTDVGNCHTGPGGSCIGDVLQLQAFSPLRCHCSGPHVRVWQSLMCSTEGLVQAHCSLSFAAGI